jgi:hypothetical protein
MDQREDDRDQDNLRGPDNAGSSDEDRGSPKPQSRHCRENTRRQQERPHRNEHLVAHG